MTYSIYLAFRVEKQSRTVSRKSDFQNSLKFALSCRFPFCTFCLQLVGGLWGSLPPSLPRHLTHSDRLFILDWIIHRFLNVLWNATSKSRKVISPNYNINENPNIYWIVTFFLTITYYYYFLFFLSGKLQNPLQVIYKCHLNCCQRQSLALDGITWVHFPPSSGQTNVSFVSYQFSAGVWRTDTREYMKGEKG